ncbi:phage tail protein I [Selenomonas artemidis]|jgi:phage tail protein I|uniref:phage tail protein I n=1 Tax=Selenomonas artemidis TaxID=671224 RepID=UPI00206E1D7E|nr:phage tail protein I [Selenomonas artemidis]DAF35331.1 MAG TPA: tail protein [Caudoviricetes sp.]
MIKDLHRVGLVDLLPENILADPQLGAAARALDDELRRVTAAVQETLHLPRLNELPERVLDILAWQWHVDSYDSAVDAETKRKLIRESIAWHRIKGTPAAVEKVIAAVYGDAKIEEWYEYGGQPYYFRIGKIKQSGIKLAEIAIVARTVHTVKNARSWINEIGFVRSVMTTIYIGGMIAVSKEYTIAQQKAETGIVRQVVYIGGTISVNREVEING